ncbi:MAG: hypothetical protein ACI82G_001629 [Bradymonadia bacterium]|jgi:hypothetical protein
MNVEQLNELNKRVEQGAFLQSRSLAFAGCMVAASLALPAEVPTVFGIGVVSFVLYVVGGALGLPLLLGLLRRRP